VKTGLAGVFFDRPWSFDRIWSEFAGFGHHPDQRDVRQPYVIISSPQFSRERGQHVAGCSATPLRSYKEIQWKPKSQLASDGASIRRWPD